MFLDAEKARPAYHLHEVRQGEIFEVTDSMFALSS